MMCGWATYVEIPTVVITYLSILTTMPNFGSFRKLSNRMMMMINRLCNTHRCSLSLYQFSYDDHGRKDVPAQLKYIMQFNQQDTLSYVGHSQGTMNFWIAMESNPDLNEKIDAMFALGPVAQIKNMKSFIKRAIPYATAIKVHKTNPFNAK